MIKKGVAVIMAVIFLNFSIEEGHAQVHDGARMFYETYQPLAGVYEIGKEKIVIGLIASAEIIYFQRLSTGDMRFMAEDGSKYKFRYSPTRNSTDLTEGRIVFPTEYRG